MNKESQRNVNESKLGALYPSLQYPHVTSRKSDRVDSGPDTQRDGGPGISLFPVTCSDMDEVT